MLLVKMKTTVDALICPHKGALNRVGIYNPKLLPNNNSSTSLLLLVYVKGALLERKEITVLFVHHWEDLFQIPFPLVLPIIPINEYVVSSGVAVKVTEKFDFSRMKCCSNHRFNFVVYWIQRHIV